jgi:hypothetical protein
MRRVWSREELFAQKRHRPVILRRRNAPKRCQECKGLADNTWLQRKPVRHRHGLVLRLRWLCWFCADYPQWDAPSYGSSALIHKRNP